ncbi:hypothetical protein ACQ4M4_14245 [Leptolyngbya sp. AN02str]|uniref:hypothetical protein n=1 Tax=Leptolyngbya sp. AN02str TaxID=3423363 RepID=UPI003D311E25
MGLSMSRIHYKSLLRLLVGTSLAAALAACGGGQDPAGDRPGTAESPATSSQGLLSPTTSPSAAPAAPNATPSAAPNTTQADAAGEVVPSNGATTTVTVYQADEQCVNFEPQQVQVPGDRPMEGAVGEILKKQGAGYFDLSGYRVSVNDGVATVDLRMSPDSDRKIASLSACEQFALFGSLRETLTKNTAWNIRDVRFTERGEEIVL